MVISMSTTTTNKEDAMTNKGNAMHAEVLKGVKKEILKALINSLEECAVLRGDGKWIVEITKPVSLAVQEAIFTYAVANGISIRENVEVKLNEAGLIVCVYTFTLKINGLEHVIVGLGEGMVVEDKDTAARTAETRAHKRALDKLMGAEGHKMLVWLGQKVDDAIRALPREQRDMVYQTATPQERARAQKVLKEQLRIQAEKYRESLIKRVEEL